MVSTIKTFHRRHSRSKSCRWRNYWDWEKLRCTVSYPSMAWPFLIMKLVTKMVGKGHVTHNSQCRRWEGTTKQKTLHNPAEQHKEGALHFTSVRGRGTIGVIKLPPLTKALSKMSTSSQKKDQMSFPDKLFAPAGKKKAFSCHNVLLRGNQPIESFKSKKCQ